MTDCQQWTFSPTPAASVWAVFTCQPDAPQVVTRNYRDVLDELIEKYRLTHKIIVESNFNKSLHRRQPVHRDFISQEFLEEHSLQLPNNYPLKKVRENQLIDTRVLESHRKSTTGS